MKIGGDESGTLDSLQRGREYDVHDATAVT
jgi:hypothetical protein